MLGIGSTEFAIILIFAFLIFGPDKLPAIAKTIGQAIAKFRTIQSEVDQVVKEEIYDPAKDTDNPFQRPLDKMAQMNQNQGPTETFAERKARHDRERAERQAAQAKAKAEDSQASSGAGAVTSAAASATTAVPTPKPAATTKPKPTMSAAELYGMMPVNAASVQAIPDASLTDDNAKLTAKPAPHAAPSASADAPASTEGGE